MPPKKYRLGETHGYIGQTKTKSKPRVINLDLKPYFYQRDMCLLNDMFVCEDTKEQIRERLKSNYYDIDKVNCKK